MNAERRVSISSYLILRGRVARRPKRTAPSEPLWSRWYVPLLAAALALVALIVAAVAALEIVTVTHQQPAHVTPAARADPGWPPEPGSHAEPGRYAEAVPDVDLISAER